MTAATNTRSAAASENAEVRRAGLGVDVDQRRATTRLTVSTSTAGELGHLLAAQRRSLATSHEGLGDEPTSGDGIDVNGRVLQLDIRRLLGPHPDGLVHIPASVAHLSARGVGRVPEGLRAQALAVLANCG